MQVEPIFTPYFSPFVFEGRRQKESRVLSYRDRVTKELIQSAGPFARFRLQPGKTDALAYHYEGWRNRLRYTYTLDNLQNEAAIIDGYKSSVRNDIKVAQANCLLQEEKDAQVVLRLHEASLDRKGKKNNKQSRVLEALVKTCLKKDQGFVLSIYKEATPVCSAFVVLDEKWAYLLALGLDKKNAPRGAIQYLLHACIRKAAQRVNQFDFEGSMLKEVEPVFRAFGAKRTPVVEVSRAPRWGEILFILLNKSRW